MSPTQQLTANRVKAAELSGGISNDIIYRAIERLIARGNLGGAVLDYGAGTGALTRRLQQLGRFSSISAADIFAKPKEIKGASWIQQDLNEPIKGYDCAFDAIIAAEVLEHLENPRFTIRELVRLLKPGGQLIVSTPNNESWRSIAALLVRGHYAAFGEASYPAHITPLLRKDISRIFSESRLSAPEFHFTNSGGIPGRPHLTWQMVSCRLFRGVRFSDNVIAFASKLTDTPEGASTGGLPRPSDAEE